MQLRAHTHWASCIEQNLLRAQQNEATEEPFIGLIEDKRQARAFLQWCIPVCSHTMHVAKKVDKNGSTEQSICQCLQWLFKLFE